MEADPFGAVDDAITAVQEVLESMMSKENLVRDQFLARNMNAQMDMSIPILLSHAKLADVGATPELVVAAATRSARLRIDDAQRMVRPTQPSRFAPHLPGGVSGARQQARPRHV